MSQASRSTDGDYILRLMRLVEEFENLWIASAPRRLEDFLESQEFAEKSELFLDCLCVEIAYRTRNSETPNREEYLERFPQFESRIEAAFASSKGWGGTGLEIPPSRLIPASVFAAIERLPRRRLPVVPRLRDLESTTGGRIHASTVEAKGLFGEGSSLVLLENIASGGMGAIYLTWDQSLQRYLVVKAPHEMYRDVPEIENRLRAEARITGRLQHPGIVPVHEAGVLADGRPYFAMKLIEGKTLAELLGEREAVGDGSNSLAAGSLGVSSWLEVLQSIVRTMAYAHSQGVIHRDLKTSNVMVGPFGEVQVMDWGLAKALRSTGPDGACNGTRAIETFDEEAEGTSAGSVLGTFAYMAPEQARGDNERVDERADVFALGSILCEILTGRPAYTGADRNEVFARARSGDLSDALARLDTCGGDEELIGIAEACLAIEPDDRPRNAAQVDVRLSGYLLGVRERLRKAEHEKIEAEARADEETKRREVADELAKESKRRADAERRRRQATLAFAASALGLLTVAGISISAYTINRAARYAESDRTIGAALARVESAREEAERAGLGDLAAWSRARMEAEKVTGLLAGRLVRVDLRRKAVQLCEAVLAKNEDAVRDAEHRAWQKRLADALEAARLKSTLVQDPNSVEESIEFGSSEAYTQAFRDAGLDVWNSDIDMLYKRLEGGLETPRIAAALDQWALLEMKRSSRNRIRSITAKLDPDPFRERLRRVVDSGDVDALLAAGEPSKTKTLQAATVLTLAGALQALGQRQDSIDILNRERPRFRDDFWINEFLGLLLSEAGPKHSSSAIRFLTAATSIMPSSAFALRALGHAHLGSRQFQEAEADYRAALELEPASPATLNQLGVVLERLGRNEEARAAYQECLRMASANVDALSNLAELALEARDYPLAEELSRKLLRLRQEEPEALSILAVVLMRQGKYEEAEDAARKWVGFGPPGGRSNFTLGMVLIHRSKFAEAELSIREAIRLQSNNAAGFLQLGFLLERRSELSKAQAAYRESLRLTRIIAPEGTLGAFQESQEELAEAEDTFREALKLRPECGFARLSLGSVLSKMRKLEEAEHHILSALKSLPECAEAHYQLGLLMERRGRPTEAEPAYRRALELEPESVHALTGLGTALISQGKSSEAETILRKAINIDRRSDTSYVALGNALVVQDKHDDAESAYRHAIEVNPRSDVAYGRLGALLKKQRWLLPAEEALRQSLEIRHDNPEALWNLGEILTQNRQYDAAADVLRELIRLEPDKVSPSYRLALVLRAGGRLRDAESALRSCLHLTPRAPELLFLLGVTLADQKKWADAEVALREAIRHKRDFVDAYYELGSVLSNASAPEEADVAFRKAFELAPYNADAHYTRGRCIWPNGRLDEAEAELREAIRLDPQFAEAYIELGRVLCRKMRLGEGVEYLNRGHKLGSGRLGWSYPSAWYLQHYEQLAKLEPRLRLVSEGKERAGDNEERLAFAEMCHYKELYAAEARLLAECPRVQERSSGYTIGTYTKAAIAAALASQGKGKDAPPEAGARTDLRRRALSLLESELKDAREMAMSAEPKPRREARGTLDDISKEAAFRLFREADSLAKLPEEEQKAWRAFWKEVDELSVKVR